MATPYHKNPVQRVMTFTILVHVSFTGQFYYRSIPKSREDLKIEKRRRNFMV